MKAGAGEAVAIIQGRAAQVIGAFAVDKKLNAIPFHDRVAGLLGTERHLVLKPGAAALGNANAKALVPGRAVRVEQAPQLPDCVIRHGDHR
jgi:hypothetical protein